MAVQRPRLACSVCAMVSPSMAVWGPPLACSVCAMESFSGFEIPFKPCISSFPSDFEAFKTTRIDTSLTVSSNPAFKTFHNVSGLTHSLTVCSFPPFKTILGCSTEPILSYLLRFQDHSYEHRHLLLSTLSMNEGLRFEISMGRFRLDK